MVQGARRRLSDANQRRVAGVSGCVGVGRIASRDVLRNSVAAEGGLVVRGSDFGLSRLVTCSANFSVGSGPCRGDFGVAREWRGRVDQCPRRVADGRRFRGASCLSRHILRRTPRVPSVPTVCTACNFAHFSDSYFCAVCCFLLPIASQRSCRGFTVRSGSCCNGPLPAARTVQAF
jgi:hypothetical protein